MNNLVLRAPVGGLLFVFLATVASAAKGSHCAQCGCCCACQQVCRLVEEEKKVEVICWGVKCEDFTVPWRSTRGCKNRELACQTCGENDSAGVCVWPKKFVWFDWIPGYGAQVYTKHKLMRGVTTKKLPGFKWVVEDLCPECTAKCEAIPVAPGIDVPPPPLVSENVLMLPPATRQSVGK